MCPSHVRARRARLSPGRSERVGKELVRVWSPTADVTLGSSARVSSEVSWCSGGSGGDEQTEAHVAHLKGVPPPSSSQRAGMWAPRSQIIQFLFTISWR